MTPIWLLGCLVFSPPANGEYGGDFGETDTSTRPSGPAYVDVLEPLPEDLRSEEDARLLKESAKAAFRDERFEEAIEFLAEAYRTFPSVTLLFALGSAHRRVYERDGETEQRRLAIRRYQQYLSAAPDAESADLAQNYLTSLLADRDLGDMELEAVTRILVSTTVEDAIMKIDGGVALPAPGVINIEPGPHEILVRANGYHDFIRSFDVPEGTTYQVQAELLDKPGALAVEGPKGAVVRLDGRIVGELPLAAPAEAPPGQHVITVSKNGYRPFYKDIVLERDGSRSVRATLDVSNQRFTSFFFMGLGAAGLVTSGVLIGLSVDRQSRAQTLESLRLAEQLSTDEFARYEHLLGARNSLRGGGLIAGLGGAVMLMTGAVLFAYDNPRLGASGGLAGLRLVPVVWSGAGGGVFLGRF